MKWLKRGGYLWLVLVAVSIPAYWWLFVERYRAPAAGARHRYLPSHRHLTHHT